MIRRILGLTALSAAIIGAGLGVSRGLRALVDATAEAGGADVPTTSVRRADVAITVAARGGLQGGGSVTLTAPRSGAAELPITFLRDVGDLVREGDVVAEFDSSALQHDLLQAEADLEEARQQLVQAEAEARIALEQARLQVRTTELDLDIAGLEQLDNEFLGTVQRRQKEIALERARNRHQQAVEALAHREATAGAGLDAQRAAVREAEAKTETARTTMAGMTLKAAASGYVELAPNTNGLTVLFSGMQVPTFRLGDIARPGQTIAAVPDMSTWEVSTQIPETERAFLAVGQLAVIRPKAMPGREFRGRIALIGGSSGSAWNRTFNCSIALIDEDDSLRPGMSVDVVINVETLKDVLWVPSQAVFEREGRWFVYRRTPEGYVTHDVALVRRTESQAIVTGIDEGTVVALAAPGQQSRAAGSGGPLGALPK